MDKCGPQKENKRSRADRRFVSHRLDLAVYPNFLALIILKQQVQKMLVLMAIFPP